MDKIRHFESSQMKKDIPEFKVGDTVKVNTKIKEEGKARIQAYEGTVISIKGSGLAATFTVRRMSYGEGVEKTFPLHSPLVESLSVVRKGKVRRSKLFYLRKKVGKKGKVELEDSLRVTAEQSPENNTPEA